MSVLLKIPVFPRIHPLAINSKAFHDCVHSDSHALTSLESISIANALRYSTSIMRLAQRYSPTAGEGQAKPGSRVGKSTQCSAA